MADHRRWVLMLGALLLVACAAPGEDSNYKENEPSMLDDDPGKEDPHSRVDPAPVYIHTVAMQAESQELPERGKTVYGTEYGPDVLVRTDWPTIHVSPDDGRTVHNPTYYGKTDLKGDGVNVTNLALPIEQRMDLAMSGSKAENWSASNLGDMVFQPVLAAGYTALLPVSMVIEPPLKQVTTPKLGEARAEPEESQEPAELMEPAEPIEPEEPTEPAESPDSSHFVPVD